MKELTEKYQALKVAAKKLMLAGQITGYLMTLQEVQATKNELAALEAAA